VLQPALSSSEGGLERNVYAVESLDGAGSYCIAGTTHEYTE
jgi:hypothetical protein